MLAGSSSRTARRRAWGLWRHAEILREPLGSSLYEFALTMPFLVVLAVGMVDFGQAWNLKQKLSNAAREGARFGASQSTVDLSQANPPSVTAIANVVGGYLAHAGLTQCSTATPANWTETPPSSGLIWTFSYSDSGCATFSLVIDRGYNFLPPSSSTTVVATHVALTYPYTWTFNNVIGMIVKGASPSLPSTISSDAVMQNLP